MNDIEDILIFAETLIQEKTETYCSELQRRILVSALQRERKTYDQLAEECGYSAKYVKQDVAPKLWQLLTRALGQKITKSNVHFILEQEMRNVQASQKTTLPSVEKPGLTTSALDQPLTDQSIQTTPSSLSIKSLTAPNILLVDDQPKNLRLLSDLLDEQGYQVQQAISGAVALQAVALDQPDLILLDIYMPDMDGYSVCQKLKADPTTQAIPVIFVSALDEAWDKVKAFSVGGVDYITKPFKMVEVLARVENQLKIQQLQKALMAQNTQLQQAIQELQRLAAIDDLTQVASRRRFDNYLSECWQQAIQSQTPLMLMLTRVDNFDFYGERGDVDAGDQRLAQIAQVLKHTVQGTHDLVGRYGTLTFAVVSPDASTAEQTAQHLLKAVKVTQHSLSIGVVTTQPRSQMGLEEFLDSCDHNLQQAKNNGGDSVVMTVL